LHYNLQGACPLLQKFHIFKPDLNRDENGNFPPIQLRIYSSLKSNPHPIGQEIYRVSSLDIDQEIEESVNISLSILCAISKFSDPN
jgi:hypothetical protein